MCEPVLVAILFADKVIVEINQKKGIIGTFHRFYTEKFPVAFPPWYIFASVTNLCGEFNFSLNLVYEPAQQVIFNRNGKIKVEDKRGVVEIFFPVLGALFPEEGVYTLTFNVEGIPVGSRLLEVFIRPDNLKPPMQM